jgi:hypothetical protein
VIGEFGAERDLVEQEWRFLKLHPVIAGHCIGTNGTAMATV